jgi:hypothetical protein
VPLLADVTHAVPCPGAGGLDEETLGVGLGDALGDSLGDDFGDGVDDGVMDGVALGDGLADAGGLDCAVHWTRVDPVGHFGAAAIDTWLSLPAARQA